MLVEAWGGGGVMACRSINGEQQACLAFLFFWRSFTFSALFVYNYNFFALAKKQIFILIFFFFLRANISSPVCNIVRANGGNICISIKIYDYYLTSTWLELRVLFLVLKELECLFYFNFLICTRTLVHAGGIHGVGRRSGEEVHLINLK